MRDKRYTKRVISALMMLSVFFLAGAAPLWAFSVDVRKLSYADNLDPETLKRVLDYDFSGGVLVDNTIVLPDGAVTTRPPSDTDLSYIFTPYPDPTNDIAVALDSGAQKATLTSAAQGGCLLSTSPNPPLSLSAVPQWDYSVQLAGFSGMTDAAKAYSVQIGFGSETPGPHPEFTASWVPGADGRILILQAEIYNDSTDLSEWSLSSAPVSGLDPAGAFIELRVRTVPMSGYRDLIFEYRFSETGDWMQLGTYLVSPSAPPLYLSFPEAFPYVALDTMDASALPNYHVRIRSNKVTVIQGQAAEFVLGVQFNDYTPASGLSFTTDVPALNAVFTPVPLKEDGGVVMKIDTAGLAAGTYPGDILYGEGTTDAGSIPFTLEVLAVSEIRFVQYQWNEATFQTDKVYLTGPVDATVQGLILEGLELEVLDANGNLIANPAVNLRSSHPLLIVHDTGFWNEIYAVDNVTGAQLIAETPDGVSATLGVNISVPDSPKVLSLGLAPDTVTNTVTGPIQFSATGTDLLGYGHDALLAITEDTREWSTDYLTVSGSFRLDLTEPPQAGTYLFNASTTGALRVTPLTVANDSSYAGIAGGIRALDSSLPIQMLEHFTLEFYDVSGNFVFARAHEQYGHTEPSFTVGAIVPGTYKVRFNPGEGSMIRPQWWPNAAEADGAQALTFTAGQTTADIYFFAVSVPTLSFTGTVKEAAVYAPTVAVSDAVIDVYADSYVPGTTTDANGSFTLTGIPQGRNFELAITKDGFTPVYSEIFNWAQNIQTLLPYGFFPAGTLDAWGVASGNGAVLGRVSQLTNPAGYLSGATVTAVNAAGGQSFPVVYQNPADGSFGGTATYDNGVFAVLNVPAGVTLQLTAAGSGWTFAQPSSWVTVRAGALSETSFFGTAASPPADSLAGTWGVLHLQYEKTPQLWFSEASRVTFDGHGSGTLTGVKNDEMNYGTADQLKSFSVPFGYTLSPNADGSMNLAMTMATEAGTETVTQRIVLSDNGNMAIQDGTGDPDWISLSTIIKIDTAKVYSNADFNGSYYGIGYERNKNTAIVDPPNGNGAYMAISAVETFNSGAGTYNYYGHANSIKSDGSVLIWEDPGLDPDGSYAVSADGTVSVQGGAFQGFLTGNGAVGIGSGSFSTEGPDTWAEYAFLKKGDQSYTTADIAGKWALAGFGDDNDSPRVFAADIGTMTCDSAGLCSYRFKRSGSDGATGISTGSVTVTVDADGGFGASLVDPAATPKPPAYAGAIGNNGNTLIFNTSFDPAEPGHRQVFIGVRASGVGDLAGGITFSGRLVDSANAAVPGATVAQVGNPATSTVSGADGGFALDGLPAGAPFSLRMTESGFADSFSANFNTTADIDATLRPYALFPDTQLSAWGVTPGTGVIRSRVIDETGAYVGGAVVTAQSLMGQSYPVCYDNGCSGLTATDAASGRYIVMNVIDGDTVTVTAAKDGMTFNSRTFLTHAAGISQGSIVGSATDTDTAALQAAFAAAIDAYNLKDLSSFMSYVSTAYLDGGTDYAAFQAQIQEEMSDPFFQSQTYAVNTVLVTGDSAVMEIVWNDGQIDLLYFRREGTDWKLYGNQQKYDAEAYSGHTATSYWVGLTVEDPHDAITAVSVSGPGIDGSISLEHDTARQRWSSWHSAPPYGSFGPEFGMTPPAPPLTYTFAVTDGQGITSLTATVDSFVEVFAVPGSPASGQTLSALSSFSWTGAGDGYRYRIELNDSDGVRLWDSDDIAAVSVLYGGPVLEAGLYSYHLVTENGDGNFSMVTTPFSISTVPPKGDINGDGDVTLADAILALRVMSGMDPAGVSPSGDVGGDGRIGMDELVYVLQYIAGLRTETPAP